MDRPSNGTGRGSVASFTVQAEASSSGKCGESAAPLPLAIEGAVLETFAAMPALVRSDVVDGVVSGKIAEGDMTA